MTTRVFAFVAAMAVAFIAHGQTTKPSAEPPMEFVLDVDGKPVEIESGRATNVTINGKDVTLQLTPKPYRLFKTGELSFRYPASHAYEEDHDEGTQQWTFDGNSNVITITRAEVDDDPADMVKGVVDGLIESMGRKNSKRKASTLSLGGKKYPSVHVTVTVLGEKIEYQCAGVRAGKAAYIVMVQDSLNDDGSVSAETKTVLDLLDRTFKLEP